MIEILSSKPKIKESEFNEEKHLLTRGLKGGTPGIEANSGSCSTSDDLQLINRGSDCFVNCVLQLLRCTDYVRFLKVNLPCIIANSPQDSYKLSKRLRYIHDMVYMISKPLGN